MIDCCEAAQIGGEFGAGPLHEATRFGELLMLNDEIREAIIARAPVRQLKELAARNGVMLIRQRALELVRRGETTLEEVNRVTLMA